MNTQQKFKKIQGLRRLFLSGFIVCLLASLGLAGASFISAQSGKTAYAADAYWEGGATGTSINDPYRIGNANQLRDLAAKVNGTEPYASNKSTLSGYFIKLTADIDMAAAVWTPIGNSSENVFSGNFDGNNYSVSNFIINISSSNAASAGGLFGYVNGGTISNLGIAAPINVENSNNGFGDAYAGGIAGHIEGGTIINSYNTANITAKAATSYAGGIAGYAKNTVITGYNTGNVSATYSTSATTAYAGGIVGQLNGGDITKSYNTGSVTAVATSAYAGGIAGYAGYVGDVVVTTIADTYNRGDTVSGTVYAGGIAGLVNGLISRSYNTAGVSATNKGGIAGWVSVGSVTGCYYNSNTAQVSNVVGNGAGFNGDTNGAKFTADMVNDGTLSQGGAMINLGGEFSKRANGFIVNGGGSVRYYPELKNFATPQPDLNITNDSRISVTIPLDSQGPVNKITYHYEGATDNCSIRNDMALTNSRFVFIVPVRDGYAFDGWYSQASGGSKCTDSDGNSIDNWQYTNSKEVYARWVRKYDIIYHNVGDASNTNPTYYVENVGAAINAISRVGYDFRGWYENAQFTGDGNNTITIASTTTGRKEYYVKWIPHVHELEFVTGNASSLVNQHVTYGSQVGVLPVPLNEGYVLTGWFTQQNGGGSPYTASTIYSFTDNTTLYAHWTPVAYNIAYKNIYEAPNDNASTYTIESGAKLMSIERDGYTFDGWFTKDDFSGGVMQEVLRGTTGAKTFYARWVPKAYKVMFDAVGGSEVFTQDVTYGSSMTLPQPLRMGYIFEGWWTMASGGIQYTEDSLYGVSGDILLYARWTKSPEPVEDNWLLISIGGVDILLFLGALIAILKNRKNKRLKLDAESYLIEPPYYQVGTY